MQHMRQTHREECLARLTGKNERVRLTNPGKQESDLREDAHAGGRDAIARRILDQVHRIIGEM